MRNLTRQRDNTTPNSKGEGRREADDGVAFGRTALQWKGSEEADFNSFKVSYLKRPQIL